MRITNPSNQSYMKEYGRHSERIEGGEPAFVRILGGGEKAYAVPPALVRHLFKRGLASIAAGAIQRFVTNGVAADTTSLGRCVAKRQQHVGEHAQIV